MKKITVVLVLICLVTAAGAYYVYYRPFSEKHTAEQMLPIETLATIRFAHLKQRVEAFRTSRLGSALAGIDIRSVMTALDAPQSAIREVEDFIIQSNETLDSPWFDALFGQQVTLALLPTEFNDFSHPTPEEISQALVVILRPKHPAKLLDSLKYIISADVEIISEDYDQWEINHFELEPGQPVHYAIVDEFAMLALHRQPLVRCLDTLKAPDASLAQHADFQAVKDEFEQISDPDVYSFINLQEMYRLGMSILTAYAGDRPDYRSFEKELAQLSGFYAAGYAAYDERSALHEQKLIFMVDRAALLPNIERVLNIQPETGAMLTMLPQSTLGFTWQNTLDLKIYYDSLIESEDLKPEGIAAMNAKLQQKFGLTVEELINSFGPEWGVSLQGIKSGGFFPIPEIGIFIESSQPEVAEQIIRQLVGASDARMRTETYGSHRISNLQLPFGSDLSPCYAFVNGYCILAANTNIMKSYIDTANGARNVSESESFKAVDQGLSDKNNQLAFIKFDELLDTVPEILNWGSSVVAMAKPDKANQIVPVVQQVVDPLVDGLKMYKTVGFRSFIAEAKIESQIYTEIDETNN